MSEKKFTPLHRIPRWDKLNWLEQSNYMDAIRVRLNAGLEATDLVSPVQSASPDGPGGTQPIVQVVNGALASADVLNNSPTITVSPGYVYMRDTAGQIALGAPATAKAIYVAVSTAAPGNKFKAAIIGPVRLRTADTATPACGTEIYLTTGGLVTATFPTDGYRWRLGWATGESVVSGLMPIDLWLLEGAFT